jgi:hypothetical protein
MAGREPTSWNQNERSRKERYHGFHSLHEFVPWIEVVNVALDALARRRVSAAKIWLRLHLKYDSGFAFGFTAEKISLALPAIEENHQELTSEGWVSR